MRTTDHSDEPSINEPKGIYAVLHNTVCDGWVNTWSTTAEDGTSKPETFSSRVEAQAALNAFLAEIEEEIARGERHTEEGYDPDDFRVESIAAAV